jgi:hypothetical protein
VSVLWILNSLSSNKSLNISSQVSSIYPDTVSVTISDKLMILGMILFNNLLEESEFKIHKTDTVSVTVSDKLMILGMIYSTIY